MKQETEEKILITISFILLATCILLLIIGR